MRERKKNRLAGYDYSHPGAYFVTLCVKNRECLFGNIIVGGMDGFAGNGLRPKGIPISIIFPIGETVPCNSGYAIK